MPAHAKCLDAVYKTLADGSILTAVQIGQRNGMSAKTVAAAIRGAPGRLPKIYSRPCAENGAYPHSQREYSLTPFPAIPRRKPIIAPRYVPPFEEMTPDKYDLWQGRNLAMLAR